MKIFITGATGFIGKQVMALLKSTQYDLCCLIRENNPAIQELKSEGIQVCEGDVRNKHSILEGMKDCDVVINLANVYSFWEPDNSVFRATNVDGTRNVMESALETKVSKVIHISTTLVFGTPSDNPFHEGSEPGPQRFSQYARTKFEGDKIAWDLYENNGLPLVVIYPGAVLGAGDPKASGQYVEGIVKKKLPATVFKNSVLTWVYVNDVAEGIVKTVEEKDNIGEKYILAGEKINFRDFNKMISEISGVSLPMVDMPDFMALSSAYLLTSISNIIKKPPLWGMAVDQMKTMQRGFKATGAKAEKDLGINYTPIRTALAKQIAAL